MTKLYDLPDNNETKQLNLLNIRDAIEMLKNSCKGEKSLVQLEHKDLKKSLNKD